MKILVFEYITGGGFNKQELPEALAHEGRLMLQALLDNFRSCVDISVTVMLDERINGSIDTASFDAVLIRPEQNSHEVFADLIRYCDAVWPIAPEFDGILQALCHTVALSGKPLLTSPADAVALTGNKWLTYQHLKQQHIATVPTRLFTGVDQHRTGQWLVKPVDGAGCADSYIVTDLQDFERMQASPGRYIIQPHRPGKKTSLSCLFKQGRGWLLCANLQQFDIINQQYHLSAIIVNHQLDLSLYQELVDNIAGALPELWGYVGIDLIETQEERLVLEINPRLTTSFVGIGAALGINVAAAVLQLLQGEPALNAVRNRPITINVQRDESD